MYNVKDPRLQGMLHYEREGVFQVPFLLIYQGTISSRKETDDMEIRRRTSRNFIPARMLYRDQDTQERGRPDYDDEKKEKR